MRPTSLVSEELWSQCLQLLERQISKENIEKWFSNVKLISLEEGRVVLQVPNPFVGEWIQERFGKSLRASLTQVFQREMEVQIVVPEHLPQIEPPPVPSWGGEGSAPRSRLPTHLNPKYTFETFVVGASNQFAHAACRAVAESPATTYNPLFIYSGVGLGKTHLLNAIGHYILQTRKDLQVTYVTAETFTNEVIHAIRYDRMADLRNKYRSVDVLLIDDIQFIAGKERTQEEFFHTFNALYENRKQIVITSDKYPREIENIDDRLRSRYEWGLLADIGPPDFETRIAILKKKAEIERISIPDDVAYFLANHFQNNVRELEGALIKLGALASFTRSPITVELARETLWYSIQGPEKSVSVEEIQRIVAEHFRIRIADLRSKRRTRNLVFPRHLAMYLCREIGQASYPEIGRAFGGKDHSTVIHSCRNIQKMMETDSSVRGLVETLIRKIRSG